MEVVLVVVGAAAGLSGSIITEIFRSRRDHARWVLERRHETYVTALVHVDRLLTWARNEVSTPAGSKAPEEEGTFHRLAANLALVGSTPVQKAWAKVDASFRQFPMVHVAAVNALRAAHASGDADSDEAIRLRLVLDEIVTEARKDQVALAKAMERDLHAAH